MESRNFLRASAYAAIATILTVTAGTGLASADRDEHRCQGHTLTVKKSGGDYSTIQAAIDAAAPGDTIDVYPGDYLEVAIDRYVDDGSVTGSGPYQFGLFVGEDRGGLTIRGVDAHGHAIKDFHKVKAAVTTDATNNFGPSGIFVEGDDVTISGLEIGVNLPGQNKTIEVTGDDFALLDCDVSDLWGSIYFGDWRFDEANDKSHIRGYRIEGNNFQSGCSIDLANGAGYSGHVEDRVIAHNDFANADYWPSISFNGSDTGIEWFVYSVGGAVIEHNSFVNTFTTTDVDFLDREGHIRARGTYDNSQFDWKAYWNENKYNHAFVVGHKPPKDVRTYSYGTAPYVFDNVRRIGALLAGEQQHQQPGDKILSK